MILALPSSHQCPILQGTGKKGKEMKVCVGVWVSIYIYYYYYIIFLKKTENAHYVWKKSSYFIGWGIVETKSILQVSQTLHTAPDVPHLMAAISLCTDQ